MQLATNETTFKVGHEIIQLRASLRAAARLSDRYGDFGKIIKAITAGNLSVMSVVIKECSVDRTDLEALLDCGGSLSVQVTVDNVAGPLVDHILILAGVDPKAPAELQPGKSIPLSEYFTKLYRIATGWLHWSPQQAWDASPAEIVEAYEGHIEMLRATGVLTKNDDVDLSDDDARRQLNAIGDLSNLTMGA